MRFDIYEGGTLTNENIGHNQVMDLYGIEKRELKECLKNGGAKRRYYDL